ncbi:MAG TPA: hypothetical protein VGM91_11960 [Conexibacter sp.]|jgi:hypothetical protein
MTTISPTNVLSRAFEIYKQYAGVLIPAALVIFAIEAILRLIFHNSSVLLGISSIVVVVLHTFYQGMVVRLVDDVRDGTLDASPADLFRSVGPVVLPLIGFAILAGIAIAIGLFLLIIPGLFLLTIWAVGAPALVVEQTGVFRAFGRSQELVKGNGWNVFGLLLILWVLLIGVSIVAGAIGNLGGDAVAAIVSWLATVAIAPVLALAASVLFFSLRDGVETVRATSGAVVS